MIFVCFISKNAQKSGTKCGKKKDLFFTAHRKRGMNIFRKLLVFFLTFVIWIAAYSIPGDALSATMAECGAASYANYDTGNGECTPCPNGYTANTATDKTSIQQCQISVSAGQYIAAAGSATPSRCPAGTYRGTHMVGYGNTSSCIDCTGATYSSVGATSCTAVTSGYYTTGCSENILPSGYTELEYLKSNGKQYIDAGFVANSETSVQVDALATSTRSIYGGSTGHLNETGAVSSGTRYFYWNTDLYGKIGEESLTNLNKRVVYAQRKNIAERNGIQVGSVPYATWADTRNFFLFARNGSSGANDMGEMTIYNAKIWDGNTLIRNMIPARRDSDDVFGMYDTVNGTFYTNAGTGTFTVALKAKTVDIACSGQLQCMDKTYCVNGVQKQCPDANTYKRTTFPSQYTPDGATTPVLDSINPESMNGRTAQSQCSIESWYTTPNRGTFYEYASFNENTKKYDTVNIWGWASVEPGYYLKTPGTCGEYAYYTDMQKCPSGSYCPGMEKVTCNTSNQSTVQTTTFGLESCPPTANQFSYTRHIATPSSPTGATSKNQCYTWSDSDKPWTHEYANHGYYRWMGYCYWVDGAGYSNCDGKKTYKECNAGYFINESVPQDAKYTNSCTPCANGSYTVAYSTIADTLGADKTFHYETTCTACAAGKYNIGTGNTSCTLSCPSGSGATAVSGWATPTWSNNTTTGICTATKCTGNAYITGLDSSKDNNLACGECPNGYTANTSTDKTSIHQCQINVSGGKYIANANSSNQSTCPAGTYRATHLVGYGDTSSCINCTGATFSSAGATSCTAVNSGWYATGCSGNNLPSGYTEMEYLKSAGTHYIDTGFAANSETSIQVEALATRPFSLYGGTPGYLNETGASGVAGRYFYWDGFDSGKIGLEPQTNLNVKTVYAQRKNIAERNGIMVGSVPYKKWQDSYNLYLFARGGVEGANDMGTMTIYNAKIWDGNTLIRNMIPARRNSDGVLGMYDTVNDKFYTNSGTGTFEAAEKTKLNDVACTRQSFCDDGFGIAHNNTCVQLCTYGVTTLRTSNGVIAPMFQSKNTTPSININLGRGVCYVDLVAGTETGTINIQHDDKTYHTVNQPE